MLSGYSFQNALPPSHRATEQQARCRKFQRKINLLLKRQRCRRKKVPISKSWCKLTHKRLQKFNNLKKTQLKKFCLVPFYRGWSLLNEVLPVLASKTFLTFVGAVTVVSTMAGMEVEGLVTRCSTPTTDFNRLSSTRVKTDINTKIGEEHNLNVSSSFCWKCGLFFDFELGQNFCLRYIVELSKFLWITIHKMIF